MNYLSITQKIPLAMRVTLILLCLIVFQLQAEDVYSQKTKISLDMKNTTIEEESDYYFLYNNKLVNVDRKVSVRVKNAAISDVLDKLFASQNVEYQVEGNQIILSPKEKTKEIVSLVEGVQQQQRTIRGKVTDQSGQPLPGATVMVKGTTQGTITDADGNYSLSNVPDDATLVFSFVGMETQEINVGNRTRIDVTLQEEAIALEEVVAVGYATRKAGELTGSVSTRGARAIEEMPVVQASEILRDVPGITIREAGTPGEEASVLIRGLGTINDNNPLWIVDGVPGVPVSSVDPNSIESISILKDASSQAIYGARSASGVILVTTKSGKKNQKPQFNFRINSGISCNIKEYDLLNTQEYAEMLWMEAKNAGISNYSHTQFGNGPEPIIPEYVIPPGASEVDLSLYDENSFPITKTNKLGTNWLKEVAQNGEYQDYNLDVNGGSASTSYSFQIGYLKEKGIFKYSGYERYNLRSNISTDINSWLEIGEKLGITYKKDYGGQEDNSEGSSVSWSYRMVPFLPVYDVMGNFAGTKVPETGTWINPVFQQYSNQYDQFKDLIVNGNIYGKISIFDNISITTLLGFNYQTSDNRDLFFVEKARSIGDIYDRVSERSDHSLLWNWSNTIEYSKILNELHNLTILLGSEAVEYNTRWRSAGITEFLFSDPHYMQLNSGIQNQQVGGNLIEWSLFSIFGRLNYMFANKYIVEGVVRRDGSSRFASENRYGIFPAFSIGWRMSNENFMDFAKNWIDQLKLRFGYGKVGNDRIGNYNAYTIFASDMRYSYYPMTGINTGGGSPGFYRSSLGSTDVKWESTYTTNFGLDATIFKNFNITFDLWKRMTNHMLYPKRIPDVRGQASPPSVNIGEMENKGFDIDFGYWGAALGNELKYNINLNVSHYKNKIIKLSDMRDESIQGENYRGNIYTRAAQGVSFPEFYGYVVEGIFQTQGEADAHPAGFTNKPGYFKFKDINGDGIINADDRTYIGSPHPDFTSAINLNVSYKDFSLTTRLYASVGNDIVNSVRRWIDFNHMPPANRSKRRLYESWGSPYLNDNKNAKMPIAIANDQEMQLPSTYFIEDGSFLRMEQLRLSYNLNNFLRGLNLRNLQIFGEITNVFTVTGYSGLDPEINMGGINTGIDLGAWPTPRRYALGINIGF